MKITLQDKTFLTNNSWSLMSYKEKLSFSYLRHSNEFVGGAYIRSKHGYELVSYWNPLYDLNQALELAERYGITIKTTKKLIVGVGTSLHNEVWFTNDDNSPLSDMVCYAITKFAVDKLVDKKNHDCSY